MDLLKIREADAETSIAWDKSYVWVAPSCRVREQAQASSEDGLVKLTREDGMSLSMPREQLGRDYFFVPSEQSWKPRYRPIKANYVAEDTMYRLRNRKPLFVQAGGAIVLDETGAFRAVAPAEYENCYEVVGFPGTDFPQVPFQSAE